MSVLLAAVGAMGLRLPGNASVTFVTDAMRLMQSEVRLGVRDGVEMMESMSVGDEGKESEKLHGDCNTCTPSYQLRPFNDGR